MTELKLKSDTAKRKRLFTAESFSHPAKCHIGMLEWILNQYTQEGEIVLDPMAGSGSILIGTLMGRHIVAVELESKFVKMAEDNLKKLSSQALYLGTKERGQAVILQGDARNLTGLMADKIITSPPYAEANDANPSGVRRTNRQDLNAYSYLKTDTEGQIGNLPYGQIDKIVSSPPYGNPRNTSEEYDDKYDLRRPKGVAWGRESFRGRYGKTEGQIGDLPYGQVDAVISSPPYSSSRLDPLQPQYSNPSNPIYKGLQPEGYGGNPNNIGNLPHGDISAIISSPPYEATFNEKQHTLSGIAKRDPNMRKEVGGYSGVDAVISSPPYEASVSASTGGERDQSSARQREERLKKKGYDPAKYQGGVGRNLEVDFQYAKTNENIGNLKSTDYLSAMLAVYEQCFSVLRNGGLLILITKNFIRDQKEIQLDSDTIQLCEEAGFVLKERHYRRLTQQSFWRTIYHHKFPNAPMLEKEDILIFGKPQQ